ncbi:MAG: hypothetical protein A4E66_02576 [Syntrophus sp. PtaB.Bin001]|nr:MAG: hypothetical protein A4E66_02576 [Syntrophus sp. PtaB.Bin001]
MNRNCPSLQSFRLIGQLGKVHNVDGLQMGDQFEHLLLAVAGGFPDHGVGKGEKRAGVSQDESVTRFDQGTKIGGQNRFRGRNCTVRNGAEGNRNGVHGPDQLDRSIAAVQADQADSLLFPVQNVGEESADRIRDLLIGNQRRNIRQCGLSHLASLEIQDFPFRIYWD